MQSRDILLFLARSEWEYVVLYVCASALVSAVIINFASKAAASTGPERRERNAVATGTMALFLVVMFVLARGGFGRVDWLPQGVDFGIRLSGALLVVAATIVNLAGRVALGRYWSNQVEIAADHAVVRRWPYSRSRHPLYASMTAFGLGLGLLSLNALVIMATLLLFLPAMRYRARHEERALIGSLGEAYRQYQQEVPMFFGIPRRRRT